mgnify:CR=1 FL=1
MHNGGGQERIDKQHQQGKLTARERINAILDVGSPFLELAPLAAYQVYGKEDVPAAGIVAGIGRVGGIECVIAAKQNVWHLKVSPDCRLGVARVLE